MQILYLATASSSLFFFFRLLLLLIFICLCQNALAFTVCIIHCSFQFHKRSKLIIFVWLNNINILGMNLSGLNGLLLGPIIVTWAIRITNDYFTFLHAGRLILFAVCTFLCFHRHRCSTFFFLLLLLLLFAVVIVTGSFSFNFFLKKFGSWIFAWDY